MEQIMQQEKEKSDENTDELFRMESLESSLEGSEIVLQLLQPKEQPVPRPWGRTVSGVWASVQPKQEEAGVGHGVRARQAPVILRTWTEEQNLWRWLCLQVC